jgi:environmental stress-induced protein Ves
MRKTFILLLASVVFTGYAVENGNVFPGMEIIIRKLEGDTLMKADDLYEGYTEGMKYSPLKLTADLTVVTPLRSKDKYTMIIII